MSPFQKHLLLFFFTSIAAFLLTAVLAGVSRASAVLCLLLFFWLALYCWHLSKLIRWLRSPKLRTVPRGIGFWDDIFSTLLLQAKSRKKRKQKLGAALQRFNRASEALPDGMLVLGKTDGRIQWLNSAAARHFHLNRDADRHGILANLVRTPEFHRLLEMPLPDEGLTLILRTGGAGVPVRVLNIVRMPFERDAELLVTQDVTASEQLDAARTAFVANVSHELRTPLTVIGGFLETLAETPDLPAEQRQEFVRLMQRESRRMNALLGDLLTLAQLESPDSKAQADTVNLSDLAGHLAEEARALSQGRHTIHTDIAADITVSGNEHDLHSALGNLVSNAVRYTPAGGEIDMVLKKRTTDSGAVEIEFVVRDTGPGIEAIHLPRLTERFYRVDAGRSRDKGGTGLGLAITKHALIKYGGRLLIESEPGTGSVFRALIPGDRVS